MLSCQSHESIQPAKNIQSADTFQNVQAKPLLPSTEQTGQQINTGNTKPEELIAFAKTVIGVPYRYGSTDPVNGFDCSGFITYVFNHFNITKVVTLNGEKLYVAPDDTYYKPETDGTFTVVGISNSNTL